MTTEHSTGEGHRAFNGELCVITVSTLSSDTRTVPALSWRTHRLRENPGAVGIVALAYGVAVAFWRLLLPHPFTLFVVIGGLTIALNDFLFPATFRITSEGAHADCGLNRVFIAWHDVKRATHGEDGVYLSPFARPSRLEAYRGVRLRFGPDNADTVRNAVRHWRNTVAQGEAV
jgi:hypothetical protein